MSLIFQRCCLRNLLLITLRQQQYEVRVSASLLGAAFTSKFMVKKCLVRYAGEAKEIAQLRVSPSKVRKT